jgi:CubicO group peptidase (beta-lactamase class C family)
MLNSDSNKTYSMLRKLLSDLFRQYCLAIILGFTLFFASLDCRAFTQPPENLGDGLQTATLLQVGMKEAPIAEMFKAIQRGEYKNIHAVLIVRNARLIFEEYFKGYDRDKSHSIRSATKSIGSVLVGIAIDHGFLPGINEPIYHYFKDKTQYWDDRAKAVSIKSLLTMTSGFDCDDHRGESFQCEKAMYKSGDWVKFSLNLPMVHQSGEYWAYNSTSLILLSEIINHVTGLSVPLFADKYLLEPLGITGFRWGFSPKGRTWLGGSVSMRPRDMAKFGQMFLNKGFWRNRKIVSEIWLTESTSYQVHSEYGMEYGYLWWRGRQTVNGQVLEAFWAQGNGGQVIFVCPTLDLVAVFTGGNYNSLYDFQFMGMLVSHILPAMLPAGPEKTFVAPDKQVIDALSGGYRCNQLRLDLFEEQGGLSSQLAGEKSSLHFEGNDRFIIPSPIFGNMNGRILRDNQEKPTGLLIYTAFSELRVNKTD